MTTRQVLKIAEDRKFQVVLVDGRPVLRGPTENVTPALLAVLKRHRERIIELLKGKN